MEVDHDGKPLRPYSFHPSPPPPPQPLNSIRMQSAESGPNGFPPLLGPTAHHAPARDPRFIPPPSPFAHKPHSETDIPQQHNSFPPPGSDKGYPSEGHYGSRHGSISGPIASPDALSQSHVPHVNGARPDGPFQSPHGPPDYRNRNGFAPPDAPPNGNAAGALHIATGQDVMSAPPPFASTSSGPFPHPQSAGPGPGPSPVYDSFYSQQAWNNSASINRKKAVRAQQACDNCRQRKARCDEQRPCSNCKENQLTCSYREIPPHKQDRSALALEAKIDSAERNLAGTIAELSSVIRQLSQRVDNISHRVDQTNGSESGYAPLHAARFDSTRSPAQLPHTNQYDSAQRLPAAKAFPGADRPHLPHSSNPTAETLILEKAQGPPDPGDHSEEKLSLPHRHTTGAHNLLSWPSIMAFGIPFKADYIKDGEENRGLLRLYGRGEGHDKLDSSQMISSPPESWNGSRTEDSSSMAAESSWGYGFKAPHPSIHAQAGGHPGGLNPDGTPNLDPQVIDSCFDSYMQRMYVLHPILDKDTIRDQISLFKARYGRKYSKKRKFEEDSPPASNEAQAASSQQHSITVERSVRNAIVLLVVALGKICGYDQALPGVTPSLDYASPSVSTGSDQVHAGASSGPYSAPTPHSAASDNMFPSPLPSTYSINTQRKFSSSGLQGVEKSNVDVIPGLAYFNMACDILGGLRGGCDLSHAQANLLAGLYMGQLAHVMSSYDFLAKAGQICQVLVDHKSFQNSTASRYLNLVKYVYWSCLQLESDILAEVQLPQSGVHRYENFMNRHLPNGISLTETGTGEVAYQTREDITDTTVKYYWAQIHLRVTLNSIHTMLYKDVGSEAPLLQIKVQSTLMENLKLWRTFLDVNSPDLRWDEDDYQATDINAARMRAKYYGAMYIINRPCVYAALHYEAASVSVRSSQTGADKKGASGKDSIFRTNPQGLSYSPNSKSQPTVQDLLPAIRQGVEDCIHAALCSTTAFDKVPGRLVVTNIFGTAHAQFGNLLVLSAVFNSYLRPLISTRKLHGLLTRTINFLDQSAAISPSLRADREILLDLREKFFPARQSGIPFDDERMTSSFSSI